MKASELKTGYVLTYKIPFYFWSLKSWLHLIISIFQGGRTHASFVCKSWGVPFIHEAKATGVRSFTCQKSLKGIDLQVISIGELTEEEIKKISLIATQTLGTKYDIINTFIYQPIFWTTRFFLRMFLRKDKGLWLGSKQKNPEKALNCSEHPCWLLSFIRPIPEEAWSKVSPNNILKVLQPYGGRLLHEGQIDIDV